MQSETAELTLVRSWNSDSMSSEPAHSYDVLSFLIPIFSLIVLAYAFSFFQRDKDAEIPIANRDQTKESPVLPVEGETRTFRLTGPWSAFLFVGGSVFGVSSLIFLGAGLSASESFWVLMFGFAVSCALSVACFIGARSRYHLTSTELISDTLIFRKVLPLSSVKAAILAGDLLVLRLGSGKDYRITTVGSELRELAEILVAQDQTRSAEKEALEEGLQAARRNTRISHAIQILFWVVLILGLSIALHDGS